MLVALAFLCAVSASDCERDATEVYAIGEGNTPTACLIDGNAGLVRNGLVARDGERIVISCRRK